MDINKVFDLIQDNDLTQLDSVLSKGFYVNGCDADGYSLLHMAVDFDNEAAVRLLLSKDGIQVNFRTHCHRLTPLHFAAQDGHDHSVRALVESGADVNCTNHTNCTPLYLAVQANHLATARLLLDCGADPNITDTNNMSPLLHAVSISKEMTLLLLERDALMSDHCRELHTALLANKADIADALLDRLSPPLAANRIGRTPLQNAVQHLSCDDPQQAVRLIARLIQLGQDVNLCNKFGTPLHILIQRNSVHNLDADPTGEALFQYFLSLDNCCLDSCVAINGTGSPLTLAFRLHKYRMAEMLIRSGADVNCCQLTHFKYTRNANSALEMLSHSGFRFGEIFQTQCRPSNNQDLPYFNRFNQWLINEKNQVMSLKNLIGVLLRKCLKRPIEQTVTRLTLPSPIKAFLLLERSERVASNDLKL